MVDVFRPVPLEEVVGIDQGLYAPDGTLIGTIPLRWDDFKPERTVTYQNNH